MADPNAVQQAAYNVPTAVVAIITIFVGAVTTITVTLIARKGERKTTQGDLVPEALRILQDSIQARDDRIDKLVEDRDAWREMAWRQVHDSRAETDDAFTLSSPKTSPTD